MNVKKLVNATYDLDQEKKRIEKELKKNKVLLKVEAKRTKTEKLQGTNGRYAHIMSDTSRSCDPRDLLEKLEELDREEEFPELVNVAISKTEKALGTMITDEIIDSDYEQYAKVSMKMKK